MSPISARVDLLNKYLKVVLEPLPYAETWSHRRLQSPSIAVLCRDGVDLNEASNYALYCSYKGAILFALKKLATFSEAQWQIPTCLSSHAFYFRCTRPLSDTRVLSFVIRYCIYLTARFLFLFSFAPHPSKFIVISWATKITRTIRILTWPELHLFQPFICIDFQNGHQHIILEPMCHLYTATKEKTFWTIHSTKHLKNVYTS